MDDERRLVVRARDGDGEAFSELACRYGPHVLALASYYVGEGDGHDAAQVVWMAVFRKLWQLEDAGRFVPWLKKLVFYQCLNYRKARGRRYAFEMYVDTRDWDTIARVVADPESPMGEALEREEVRRRISRHLDALPAEYGMILRLYYFRGLDTRRIAELTGLPVTTIKGRLYQGRKLLRAGLAMFMNGKGYRNGWNG